MLELINIYMAIAIAIMGGVFFTFSSFVMTALGNIAPDEGMKG